MKEMELWPHETSRLLQSFCDCGHTLQLHKRWRPYRGKKNRIGSCKLNDSGDCKCDGFRFPIIKVRKLAVSKPRR
jgi:hypothetical protein